MTTSFQIADTFGVAVDKQDTNQKKNTDGFVKYLISFKYHDEKAFGIETKEVPLEFQNYNEYYNTFEALLMNEYVANIKSSLTSVLKDKGSKSLQCIMKLFIQDGQEEANDFPMLLLKLKKKEIIDGDQLVSYKDKDQNELFDLAFAKHYLIIISSQKELKMEDINKENFKTGFTMLAYLNNQDRKNANEVPRAMIPFEFQKVKNYWKREWTECYVHPVEKMSTFLREFISLKLFISCDVNRNIFSPKGVSNIIDEQNTEFFKNFFDNISNKYNPGQLEAIKAVCMARNGICLLQGPPGTGKTHTLVGIVSGIYHFLKNSSKTHRKYMMVTSLKCFILRSARLPMLQLMRLL
jgi:senataxin